jgi:hypothetical protein
MLSMFIVILWATFGRINCANSVQACFVCFAQLLHKLWPGFVQTLCKDLHLLWPGCQTDFPNLGFSHAIFHQRRQRMAGGKCVGKLGQPSPGILENIYAPPGHQMTFDLIHFYPRKTEFSKTSFPKKNPAGENARLCR